MPLSPNPYAALKEASQYVRLFRGKTFVVKVGGEVLTEPKVRKALLERLAARALRVQLESRELRELVSRA